ncbi:MAG: hypothetical protein IKP86_10805 [Anaerolineaceae bacterium]|nr:hypothetical protein [Anaerolineaceae bacterium]
MNVTVKNTKLFNFYIGMAKRIINKRDAMGNQLLGYVRVSADMQNETITIESNDIVSGIRVETYASELNAEILEEGSVLLSESVCDWLKGAREPLMIIRNGTEDSGTIQCGGEKLVMKDNDFDELEFLEIRSIPDNHVKIFADAVSFCRGLRSCGQHADPSTLSSQGLVLESKNGIVDISTVSANGSMMCHYQIPTPSMDEVRIVLDAASVCKASQTILNHVSLKKLSNLTVFFAGESGCWITADGLMVYSHALSSNGFDYRKVEGKLLWEDSISFSKEILRAVLSLRKRVSGDSNTLGLTFGSGNLIMDAETVMGAVSSDIPSILSTLSDEKEKILVDTKNFTEAILKLPDTEYGEVKIRLERNNAESSPLRIQNGFFTAFLAPKVLR